jgi:hypothetical protein
MQLEEEGEVGIQGCLIPKPDNSFLKIILGQYTYPCFGLKDSRVRKSLFSSIGLWLGYPSTRTVCEITQLRCRDY